MDHHDRSHRDIHEVLELAWLTIDWLQHVSKQNERLIAMSATAHQAIANVLSHLAIVKTDVAGVAARVADIQARLDAALAGGTLSPEDISALQTASNDLGTVATDLEKIGQSPAPPVTAPVDPSTLSAALVDATNKGASAVQLQVVTNLGDGVTTPIMKSQLAAAVTAAAAAAFDGSAPATADQLSALVALTV